MAILTLHATCLPSNELSDVQFILDTMDTAKMAEILMPKMVKNPIYIQRISDVCKDVVRFGYL